MKKILSLVLVIALLLITGCSKQEAEQSAVVTEEPTKEIEVTEESEEDITDLGEVEVDKNLLDVEITLPASMFKDETPEEINASAKEQGIKDVTINDDGSVVYKLSKAKHKEILEEMKASNVTAIEEMKVDFPSVKEISYNDDFSEFAILVNREEFESGFDGFISLGLGMTGMIYKMFEGNSDAKVTINIKDEATGEIFNTVVYPDALDNMG